MTMDDSQPHGLPDLRGPFESPESHLGHFLTPDGLLSYFSRPHWEQKWKDVACPIDSATCSLRFRNETVSRGMYGRKLMQGFVDLTIEMPAADAIGPHIRLLHDWWTEETEKRAGHVINTGPWEYVKKGDDVLFKMHFESQSDSWWD